MKVAVAVLPLQRLGHLARWSATSSTRSARSVRSVAARVLFVCNDPEGSDCAALAVWARVLTAGLMRLSADGARLMPRDCGAMAAGIGLRYEAYAGHYRPAGTSHRRPGSTK